MGKNSFSVIKVIKTLIDWLENIVFAFIVLLFVIFFLLTLFSNIGIILIVIILGYVIGDIIFNLNITGGKGILQVRLFGTKTVEHGHGLIAFCLFIIISTIFAGLIVDGLINSIILPQLKDTLGRLAISLAFSLIIGFDLWLRFYWRK